MGGPQSIYALAPSVVAVVPALEVGARAETVLFQSADDLGASARDSGAFVNRPGRAFTLRLSALVALKKPRAHSRLDEGVL